MRFSLFWAEYDYTETVETQLTYAKKISYICEDDGCDVGIIVKKGIANMIGF